MTPENLKYRTSPFFLRNTLYGVGKYQIPIIPKFQISEDDFKNLRLIGYDKAKTNDDNHFDRMVHFFLYNYKFEKVWAQQTVRPVFILKIWKFILMIKYLIQISIYA